MMQTTVHGEPCSVRIQYGWERPEPKPEEVATYVARVAPELLARLAMRYVKRKRGRRTTTATVQFGDHTYEATAVCSRYDNHERIEGRTQAINRAITPALRDGVISHSDISELQGGLISRYRMRF